jgi:hypothetical protein
MQTMSMPAIAGERARDLHAQAAAARQARQARRTRRAFGPRSAGIPGLRRRAAEPRPSPAAAADI